MTDTDTRKVRMTFEEFGRDGNAFGLLGVWDKHAKRQGWLYEERKAVIDEAKSKDYDHLLRTLSDRTDFIDDEDEDWE